MQNIFIPNGYIALPEGTNETVDHIGVGTLLGNLYAYGYTLDRRAFEALSRLSREEQVAFWEEAEPIISAITGANRNMEEAVVYKNFPREALELDRATQLFHQLAIYIGFPSGLFTEAPEEREPLDDVDRLKALTLADTQTGAAIYSDLVALPSRWTDNQNEWVRAVMPDINAIHLGDFGFKENGIALAAEKFDTMEISGASGTDILRLVAVLSEGDVSLREKTKFRSFKRAERRRLLAMMEENASNLMEDFATRPEPFKRLMNRLHPGDHADKFPQVNAAFDALYRGEVKTFAAKVERALTLGDEAEVISLMESRPGELARKFHSLYGKVRNRDALVDAFIASLGGLSVKRLAGLRSYFATASTRSNFIAPPKGRWSDAKIQPNNKTPIAPNDLQRLDAGIGNALKTKLSERFPDGVCLDAETSRIRLQTNDQKLAEYGRGTTFDIPENVTFIRSASYWEHASNRVVWYDNGWNFFDDKWVSLGTVGWDNQKFPEGYSEDTAAIFSGDPVNIDQQGKGCQMADLYLDKLREKGVRYAVWNVLCYSSLPFSDAVEVLATLQWGDKPQTGKLYEPARAQMVFPLKSDDLTSYVAYIDLETRKLVYMDAPLRGVLRSTRPNGEKLQAVMPAYVEYLAALPTVHDLLVDLDNPAGVPVLYSDKACSINEGEAFVFRQENSSSSFDRISLEEMTK